MSLELWDYRRRVAEIYQRVRADPDPEAAWRRWRYERDELFRTHAESAVPAEARETFAGLPYFPYDPRWRLEGEFEVAPGETEGIDHSGEGATAFRRLGKVHFRAPNGDGSLTLLWLESYGGGVFLPFRDATNGSQTYGGGRYLLDSAKGADLGGGGDRIVLDFNFAYHPSCVHDYRWSCPLAPPENRLTFPVEAGERLDSDPIRVRES